MYENIILIPYRQRQQHLNYFIKNAVPLFKQYLPNTKIIVIEQGNNKEFNRGKLLNVGFKEYQNNTNFFITHDVDIIPLKNIVQNVYNNNDAKVYQIKSAHASSLGGIVKFKHDVVFDINGFPNDIWGWGIEDRALFFRCYIRDIKVTINTNKNYEMLHHKSNAAKYTGKKQKQSQMWMPEHINSLSAEDKDKLVTTSGLNNLEYTIISRTSINDMVELIKVDI
jgi:beta-1,4-galactosyltransferase 1